VKALTKDIRIVWGFVEMNVVGTWALRFSSERFLIGIAAILIISTLCPAKSSAQDFETRPEAKTENSRSATVYLIDKSSSMHWIFDEIRENLKEAARKSEPNDSFSIILFGDGTTTLASYRSMDESKKEILAKLLDSVYPDSFYTNLALAIKRGTESLHRYFQEDAAEDYTLVLVTDGKNNPSPNYVQDYTFEEALTQFPEFLPGKDWSFRYIVLESQIDSELLAMVGKYGESLFDVEKIAKSTNLTQKEIVGSLIENPLIWETFGVIVVDQSGQVEVKRVFEETWSILRKGPKETLHAGDSIAVGKDSKAAIGMGGMGRIGLNEDTRVRIDNLQCLPMEKSATIKLKLEKGTIWSAVDAPQGGLLDYEVLTPIAVTAIRGTVLRIELNEATQKQSIAVVEGRVETSSAEEDPSFEKFTLKSGTYSEISPGEQPPPPVPIPEEILRDWGRWMKALIWRNPFSRINFEEVRVTPGKAKITMGPLKPNKKLSQFVSLTFSQEYFGKEPISVKAAVDLPPGVNIETKIIEFEDNKLMKNILISIECSPYLKYTGSEAYSGRIELKCREPDIRFVRHYIDLEILHSRPSFVSQLWNRSPRMRALITIIVAVVALFALLMTWFYRRTLLRWKRKAVSHIRDKIVKTRLVHLFKARPSGHLALLSAPFTDEKGAFDLADISRRTRHIVVGIGSSGSNSIVLSHASVQPFHCRIWATRQRNPTQVFIEPCSKGHLKVNKEPMKERRQLQDKDIIEIGECRFQFIDRQHHQVRVRMINNKIHEGKLEYWDLSQSIFYMTGEFKKEEKFLSLRFEDVSHVHFYRDESARGDIIPHPLRDRKVKKRKAVKVILLSNRKLSGYVDRKYKHRKSTGMFLYPASKTTDIQYTYIPRTSIRSIVIVNPR